MFSQLLEGSDTLLSQVVDIGSADAAADFWKGEKESETDKKFGSTTLNIIRIFSIPPKVNEHPPAIHELWSITVKPSEDPLLCHWFG